MQIVTCPVCTSSFNRILSRNKYCSRPCYWKDLKGKSVSPQTQFKKGQKLSEATKAKMKGRRAWNKGKHHAAVAGEKNILWKGKEAGYANKHKWLSRRASKYMCSCCKATHREKRLNWASLSESYERSLKAYIPLCYGCHWYFDREGHGVCHENLTELLDLKLLY